MSQAQSDDLYQAIIMERARTPRYAGPLAQSDCEGEGNNPMCGDRIKIRLRCDGEQISDFRHETRGCAICLATADLMGDVLIGETISEAQAIANRFDQMILTGAVPEHANFAQLQALSEIHHYRSRHRCALLPWQALRSALTDSNEVSS